MDPRCSGLLLNNVGNVSEASLRCSPWERDDLGELRWEWVPSTVRFAVSLALSVFQAPLCSTNMHYSCECESVYRLHCLWTQLLSGTPTLRDTYRGRGELHKLEFLQFKFCTKILYTICSVLLKICAGNSSKRPLFLMSNYWEPYIICSLIYKKWHRFCRARICRFIFSPARNTPR